MVNQKHMGEIKSNFDTTKYHENYWKIGKHQ